MYSSCGLTLCLMYSTSGLTFCLMQSTRLRHWSSSLTLSCSCLRPHNISWPWLGRCRCRTHFELWNYSRPNRSPWPSCFSDSVLGRQLRELRVWSDRTNKLSEPNFVLQKHVHVTLENLDEFLNQWLWGRFVEDQPFAQVFNCLLGNIVHEIRKLLEEFSRELTTAQRPRHCHCRLPLHHLLMDKVHNEHDGNHVQNLYKTHHFNY